jgi:ribonuclease HI
MKNVSVITDGSRMGNPGPGGWASCCDSAALAGPDTI